MHQCSHTLLILVLFFSATNAENKELNNVKNQLTGEFGGVPDTARYYKVNGSSERLCLKVQMYVIHFIVTYVHVELMLNLEVLYH